MATTLTTARARELAERRHSLDTYIKSLVDRAPELTPAQRDKLATLLRRSPPDSGGPAA